jgi:crossover junction endodeoxyribonuclease RuvC
MPGSLRVLGIDPGYATVGWGAVDFDGYRFAPVEYGALITEASMKFELRLERVWDGLSGILKRLAPQAVAVERLYFTTNQKTAIAVAEARGVILLCATKHGVPVFEYTPLQVKQSVVGYGKAEKNQVMQMVKTLLKLDKLPKPDDVSDALAIAVCHAHTAGVGRNLNNILLTR